MSRLSRSFFGVTLAVAACGGKVVADQQSGSVGAGGSTASSASIATSGTSGAHVSSSTSGAGGGPCAALQMDLEAKLLTARVCSDSDPVLQCTGSVVAKDTCGCPIVVNASTLPEADAANAAYDAWVAAGCGPFDCKQCPPGPGAPYACLGGYCQPNWND